MRKILIILSLTLSVNISAQDILSLKERAEFINGLQQDRFNNLLPSLMKKLALICGFLLLENIMKIQ